MPVPDSTNGAAANRSPGVAAWDFDGTITEHDTLVRFLVFIAGKRSVGQALARLGGTLAQGVRSSERRNDAKEGVLAATLGGRTLDDVTQAGLVYAKTLPRQFRRSSLEQIAWHRAQGHRMVIVSASLVYYLRPVAADLGFEHVIAVEMEVGSNDVLTGALTTPNVRKEQKAIRLAAWLGDTPRELWAYGDSSGDDELLEMSDHPTWVGKRAN